jgi:hypothetical protein
MNNDDLRTQLRERDPMRHEPGLSEAQRAVMRQAIVAAASHPVRPAASWRGLALAAATAMVAVLGVAGARSVATSRLQDGARDAGPLTHTPRRTQVQFATPGGTRVIWTLDPDFQLREGTR